MVWELYEQWIVDTGWPLKFCLHCSGRQIWFTSWSRPCLVNVIKFAWKWLRVSAAVFVWIESRCSWLRWGYQIIGTAAKQIQSLDTAWCRGQGWPELGTGKQFCWRRSCELGVKWCFHTILLTRLPGTVHVLQAIGDGFCSVTLFLRSFFRRQRNLSSLGLSSFPSSEV